MKEIIRIFNENPNLIAISGVIVPALVAFIVSKVQAGSTEKQLDKQLKDSTEKFKLQTIAEVEKIKYQYELEQRRDDINFLNKFKLEKLAILYELVARKIRYVVRINNNVKQLITTKQFEELSTGEIKVFIEKRTVIENEEFDENLMREISIAMNYFPELNQEWERINSISHKVIDLYIDQMLGIIVIKNEEYFFNKLPSDYTVNKYLIDIDSVESDFTSLINKIGMDIQNIMNNLEHSGIEK